jgi:hypothetical protein
VNVSQLITLLQQAPQDAEVTTEGCDCVGETFAVMVERDGEERVKFTAPGTKVTNVIILRESGAIYESERAAAQILMPPETVSARSTSGDVHGS